MKLALLLAVLLVAVAAPARAADPPPADSTAGIVDFGYVQTSGNTDVQTVNGRERIEHYAGPWRFAQEATAVQGSTKGIETTARYTALLRAGYDFSERIGVYALTEFRREPYAGLDHQFDESIGLTFHALRPKPHELDFDAGVGMLQREFVTHLEENFATARFGTRYRYYFSDKAIVSARADYLMNLEDTGDGDLHGVLALIAPLTAGISLRVGYDYYYRTEPAAGFEKTDTTFDTGIQIRF
jgi:putative salt-induced outer membrane protein